MMRRPDVRRMRAGVLGMTLLAPVGCAARQAPEPVAPEPEPVVELPALSLPPPQAEAPALMAEALAALSASDYGAATAGLLEVVDLCGPSPLGEQALLLMAMAELDPRNPDPRRDLAAEAVALVIEGQAESTWVTSLTQSLYAIALKLGARRPTPGDAEASELERRFRTAGREEEPAAETSTAAEVRAVPLNALFDEDPAELATVEIADYREGRQASRRLRPVGIRHARSWSSWTGTSSVRVMPNGRWPLRFATAGAASGWPRKCAMKSLPRTS